VRKLLSSAIVLAGLFAAAGARALPAGAAFDVFVAPPVTQVGTWRFALDDTIPGYASGACRYAVAWQAPSVDETSLCILDEITWLGRWSCLVDALAPMDTIVVLAPGQTCAGWDGYGQAQPVFELIAGESAVEGGLAGMIQYTAANAILTPMYLTPAG
jgi:hypothetical protein